MIYLFENEENNASIVYVDNSLTEEQKQQAVVVEKLPQEDKQEGKYAILKVKKSTNEVWYEYFDVVPSNEEIQADRLTELEGSVMELTLALATLMGGTN